MNWIIQVYLRNEKAKTGRWMPYRHQGGSKLIARFETLGALVRFVRHHSVNAGQQVRAYSEITKEIREFK
jgi:hypothetical protein